MSTGGIFTLITNDGNQDRLLLASSMLKTRLTGVAKTPNQSWAVAVKKIQQTHIMFVDGAYKPFVASGFEYNKVQCAAGAPSFDSSVNFVVPVFGDFVNDAVVHIKLAKLRTNNLADKIRYVAFPGHKIFSKMAFSVHGTPLDSYTSDDYNAYYNFHVPPNKKTGWLRNMGQEIPHQAYLTADPEFDSHREYKSFGDGFQTFKQNHDELELWVPLLFWFKDIKTALPNIAIPYGQTKVECSIAPFSDLVGVADFGGGGGYTIPTISKCELYINNIFVNPEIHNIFIKNIGFTLIRVHLNQQTNLYKPNDTVHMNSLKWPVETMYVAFKPKSNASLSQNWHKSSALELKSVKTPVAIRDKTTNIFGKVSAATSSTAVLSATGPNVLSAAANFYVGYLFIITGGAGFSATNDELNRHTVTAYNGASKTISVASWNNGPPDSTTVYEMYECIVAVNFAQYYKEVPSIDTIKIQAHGVTIYREIEESFYNSYLPYRFGKTSNTPDDRGWYMVNFNFYPGEHQPSGHINISRAREFYISYTSKLIGNNNPADLIILADAINFLLVSDGAACLHYST